jgi:hypothetical protein
VFCFFWSHVATICSSSFRRPIVGVVFVFETICIEFLYWFRQAPCIKVVILPALHVFNSNRSSLSVLPRFFLFVFLVRFFILFIAAWYACDSHFSIQQNQCTALMVAAEHGQADCARLLMDAGADKDFKNKV